MSVNILIGLAPKVVTALIAFATLKHKHKTCRSTKPFHRAGSKLECLSLPTSSCLV
jgi:hypothetical protein